MVTPVETSEKMVGEFAASERERFVVATKEVHDLLHGGIFDRIEQQSG
jgi:aryl-alcohol dehydrogenase-like predicted oxidoreductase